MYKDKINEAFESTTDDGYTTIKDVKIGDSIYGADGKKTKVINKSIIFEKPTYRLYLDDILLIVFLNP